MTLQPDGEDALVHLALVVTIDDRITGEEVRELLTGYLFDVELRAGPSAFGLEDGHELDLRFLGLDLSTRALVEAGGATRDKP